MRGLLTFYRGLHTLSNRQARRKAGIVGSRCGFCGTQSNSKVRFELLLRLGSGKQCDTLWLFQILFVAVCRVDVAHGVACNFLRCGCAGEDETRGVGGGGV